MKLKQALFPLLAALCCFIIIIVSKQPNRLLEDGEISVIPLPAKMVVKKGHLDIELSQLEGNSQLITTTVDSSLDIPEEGYRLQVTTDGITITASSPKGVFYAKETLKQLHKDGQIPVIEIEDQPRLGYRGIMIDLSRHFFDKEQMMKIIDILASYKINTLHLHLTDAGGWRLEIDSYPLLIEKTSYRTQSDWTKWWDSGTDRRYLPKGSEWGYGGYYTKAQMREIIEYASTKFIDIIPEIELPGHSDEVTYAYPELCCSGRPFTSGDLCIGNPKSYQFIDSVLNEVIELFPSKYIHIGGDEASKTAWAKCRKCQLLMADKGYTHIDQLQSHMIHFADSLISSKGRKLIGWDEILEGGLSPGATVMSWRGEGGGIKAARMRQDVIMTPGNYMYLDFYQADPVGEPHAIGGYTPVKKVYSYNPIPVDSLTEAEQKHVIGVQANLWTEYVPTDEHLEYMLFPRALAVAEVGWTPQILRSWENFKPRMNRGVAKLKEMGVNTFPLSNDLDVASEVDYQNKSINVYLDAEKYPAQIRYTVDGTTPTAESPIYEGVITTTDSARIRAAIFTDGIMQGKPTEKDVDYHRGIGKEIKFNSKLYHGYMAGGKDALLDGYRGGLTYLDGLWQGYLDNLDCVVDMSEVTTINSVGIRFMQLIGPGVHQPTRVVLSISEDGEKFTRVKTITNKTPQTDTDLSFTTYSFEGEWKARYIKIEAPRYNKAFTFADEIVIW